MLLIAAFEFLLLKLSHTFEESFFARALGGVRFLKLRLRETPYNPSLRDGNQVGCGPIQSQGTGVRVAESEEEERHEPNNALLHGVSADLWCHAHLENHSDSHDDGQHVDGDGPAQQRENSHGIHLGKVADPADEGGTAEFRRRLQHVEEGEEDGDLQEHRQATTHGRNVVIAVKLEHLLAGFLLIIGIFLADFLNLRLQEAHALHAGVALTVERPDDETHDKSHRHNSPTPVPEPTVEDVNQVVHGVADDVENAVIHHVVDLGELLR